MAGWSRSPGRCASASCCRGWRGTCRAAAALMTIPPRRSGPAAGFLVAWSYWISVWVTNAVLAVGDRPQPLGRLRPAWPRPGVGAAVAIATIWAVTLLNCLGVRTAGGVQLVTTLLKLLPLIGVILAGFWLLGSGQAALPAADARRSASARSTPPRPSRSSRCSASKARWRRATGSRIPSATCRAPP